MSEKAKVAYADLSQYQRTIVVSDIHGDNAGFLGTLEQTGFNPQDALVIVGDILEKGEHSLELLRTVMQCVQSCNVYMIAGNNDIIFSEWYNGEVTDEEVRAYMNARENIILREMAQELEMGWETISRHIITIEFALIVIKMIIRHSHCLSQCKDKADTFLLSFSDHLYLSTWKFKCQWIF